jgi:hypothetical protein
VGCLTLRASGPADADAVWEAYADPQRWSSWSPQIARVETTGRLRPGLTGRVWSYLPPPVRFEVLTVDATRRRWTWRVAVGPVGLTLEHSVDRRPRGAQTALTARGPWPVLLAYAPLARLALHRLVRVAGVTAPRRSAGSPPSG